MNPLDEYAKVPCREAFAHPLSAACATGAIARASAAAAAIANVFAKVLRIIFISYVFVSFCFGEEISPPADTGGKQTTEPAAFCYILFARRERALHQRAIGRDYRSVESMERRRRRCTRPAGGPRLSRAAPDGSPVYEG